MWHCQSQARFKLVLAITVLRGPVSFGGDHPRCMILGSARDSWQASKRPCMPHIVVTVDLTNAFMGLVKADLQACDPHCGGASFVWGSHAPPAARGSRWPNLQIKSTCHKSSNICRLNKGPDCSTCYPARWLWHSGKLFCKAVPYRA